MPFKIQAQNAAYVHMHMSNLAKVFFGLVETVIHKNRYFYNSPLFLFIEDIKYFTLALFWMFIFPGCSRIFFLAGYSAK